VVTLALLDPQTHTPQKQWRFENSTVIRVGRAPDNDVVIEDPVVSREHLELRASGGESWQLISSGSNGTFVNGVLVFLTAIRDGDSIQLARGGPLLKFRLDGYQFGAKPPDPLAPAAKKPASRAQGGKKRGGRGINVPIKGEPDHLTPGGEPDGENLEPPCTHGNNPPGNLFCENCGEPIFVLRTIRQYQVLQTLGQGGMGTTYLACVAQSSGSKPYKVLALKEMNADMTRIPKAQELFEREARVLQTLNHPGIPMFFDYFVDDGKKYLAMEAIHGQDLERRVLQRGPVPVPQAIEWMIQTCEVLDYLHNLSPPLVHRDIKPANLLLRHRDNRVVAIDFGAVKEIGTPLGTRSGAPDYTAPEQNRGEPIAQSDLYGVGATLIFLLTGESPQKFLELKSEGYRFNLDRDPRIPPELRFCLDKATAYSPSLRYQTASELARALADCLD